jgi:4-hydroxy-tetrahydrodipicolinate reductase
MNIALIGYGKMGQAIGTIAKARGHKIVCTIDHDNQDEFTKENIEKADVAIEFTGPHSAVENLKKCIEFGVPTICGSTGWLQELPLIEAEVKTHDGAFLYASNFSMGVNIFFELNKLLAKLLGNQKEYEVAITEIHHTAKKDAPSGTAITLAEQVLAENKTKENWVNDPTANPHELFIESLRIDPAPGTHSVHYRSAIDDIEIKHTAHNRSGFALGAVLAAEFINGKKGIFTMKDVLGI